MKPNSTLSRIVVVLLALFTLGSLMTAQTLKNTGVINNAAGSTLKAVNLQNHNSNNGEIFNAGIIHVTTSLDNDFATSKIVDSANGVASYGTIWLDGTSVYNNGAGDTYNGAGTIRIPASVTFGAGTFTTRWGTVIYRNAGSIYADVANAEYGTLRVDTTGTGTSRDIAGAITANAVVLNGASGSEAELDVNGQTLTIIGSGVTANGGASALFTASAVSSEVDYAADAAQTIYGTTYYNLTLSGATAPRTKAAADAVVVSNAMSVGADNTLDVNNHLTFNGTAAGFTNSGAITLAGDALGFADAATNGGDFTYDGTVAGGLGAQDIAAIQYTDLLLSDDVAKTFPNTTVKVAGVYTINGGTGARSYGTGTFQFNGNTASTQTISGLAETFYTLSFDGSDAKNLGGTSIGASRFEVLGTSGVVTNDVTTVTLTNITGVSMTIASGGSLVNNASKTITMNGDLENDGTITNSGTITVE